MTRTPDTLPTPASRPELSDAERTVLSIDNIDAWRAEQKSQLSRLRLASPDISDQTYIDTFQNGIDDELNKHLETQGVTADSDNYDEVRSVFRDASIDRIHDSVWYTSPASRGEDPSETKSQRDLFVEKIGARVNGAPASPDGDPDPDPDIDDPDIDKDPAERIKEAREAVENAREEWARLSAKRQGRLKMFDRRNRKGEIPEREEYFDRVNELGRLELADMLSDDDVSEQDKNVAVIEYLCKEQAKLRELTTEKLQNTKVSKFIKWMNKGNVATRIAKGLALGAGAGVVGAFAAGALGTGAAVAGVAGVTRFARGFALKDKDARGMRSADEAIDRAEIKRLADEDMSLTGEARERSDRLFGSDYFAKAGGRIDDVFEADTQYEQVKRRKAAAWGMGMVAVGSTIGYGVHAAAEAASNADLQLWHPFGGNTHAAPEPGHHAGPGGNPGEQPGGSGTHTPEGPGTPEPGAEGGIDWSHYPEAEHVRAGQGFYETFAHLKMPQDIWADVLHDAGPELQQQGWAYRMSDGQWGIPRPGNLPPSALNTIAEYAAKHGYVIK